MSPSLVFLIIIIVSSQRRALVIGSDVTVDIQPVGHQLYWCDSEIEITCRSSEPFGFCIWYVNNKTIAEIPQNNLVYQSYNENLYGKCRIFVRIASKAESGEWTCRLYPRIDRLSVSASINVTILKLSLREFWIIFSSLMVSMTLLVVIVWLVVKTRRLKVLRQQENVTTTITDRCLTASFNCSRDYAEDEDTPPPSYSTAVGSRIMAGECARLEFARFLNEMARHSHQQQV